nr:MAG TPA: hypothetical protein [Caudoviricetes sp.]
MRAFPFSGKSHWLSVGLSVVRENHCSFPTRTPYPVYANTA